MGGIGGREAWAGFLCSNPHLLSRVLFLRIPIGLLGNDFLGLETLCCSRLLLGQFQWVLSGNIMPKRSRKRKPEADEPRKAKWSRKPTKPKKRSRKKPKPKLQSRWNAWFNAYANCKGFYLSKTSVFACPKVSLPDFRVFTPLCYF